MSPDLQSLRDRLDALPSDDERIKFLYWMAGYDTGTVTRLLDMWRPATAEEEGS